MKKRQLTPSAPAKPSSRRRLVSVVVPVHIAPRHKNVALDIFARFGFVDISGGGEDDGGLAIVEKRRSNHGKHKGFLKIKIRLIGATMNEAAAAAFNLSTRLNEALIYSDRATTAEAIEAALAEAVKASTARQMYLSDREEDNRTIKKAEIGTKVGTLAEAARGDILLRASVIKLGEAVAMIEASKGEETTGPAAAYFDKYADLIAEALEAGRDVFGKPKAKR